jgi:hypothetical protein
MEHYSHIRMEAKRKTFEGLAPVGSVQSEDSSRAVEVNSDYPMLKSVLSSKDRRDADGGKLLTRMVGPCGLEPQTSTVSIRPG